MYWCVIKKLLTHSFHPYLRPRGWNFREFVSRWGPEGCFADLESLFLWMLPNLNMLCLRSQKPDNLSMMFDYRTLLPQNSVSTLVVNCCRSITICQLCILITIVALFSASVYVSDPAVKQNALQWISISGV